MRFTGRVTTAELVQHYNRAEMLACPSLYEGFGLPAGEAMACGLPVAATTGGALPEVVEDGVTGILVPPGDAPALAEAIRTLMGDADLRRRMGQAGRERVLEKFSWRKAALETEAVYREALGGRGCPTPAPRVNEIWGTPPDPGIGAAPLHSRIAGRAPVRGLAAAGLHERLVDGAVLFVRHLDVGGLRILPRDEASAEPAEGFDHVLCLRPRFLETHRVRG